MPEEPHESETEPDTEPETESVPEPVLAMSGDLDIVTEERWLRAGQDLLDAHPAARGLTVDLGAASFVDSRGMAVLVALHSAALARGGKLSLRAVPTRVQRALHAAGLDQVFAVES